MVPAVVGAYQCNGTVDWLEEEHPYYPPTVNDPAAAEFAKGVVGKLLGKSNVSVLAAVPRLSGFGVQQTGRDAMLHLYHACRAYLLYALNASMHMQQPRMVIWNVLVFRHLA
jgi:hypothetical protein